jgi:tetratricopeptide (TPR) repeat protein
MFSLFSRKPYNRSSTLDAADKARGRGRVKNAIAGYSTILEKEPNDHQVHARIAPLLAKVRRWDESRKSFDAAADGYLAAGFNDKAIAIWIVAAQHFPEEVQYWERIANAQLTRGRRVDAVLALLQGRGRLRSRSQRPQAISLLEQVLAIEPFHFEATLDLAGLFRREGQKLNAEKLLNDLSHEVRGPKLRKIRAAQFRLSPSFGSLLAWVRGR